MVDENEVKRWIARLETEESSWTNYEKLAALYIIRNEHGGEQLQAKAPPMLYYNRFEYIGTKVNKNNNICCDFATFRRAILQGLALAPVGN